MQNLHTGVADGDCLVLGIETSCDETAAAVIKGGRQILSNVISSQMEVHRPFGGVVPEVASRRHVERITAIIEEALLQAEVKLEDLSAIGVTQGPGLVGALLIGVSAAKALSFSTGIPLIAVHHIAGHIYANHLVEPLRFPLVALVVSGGHTELIYMPEHNRFECLGRTRDDAAGEAFDKVGRLLDLPYPGGPEIDRLAMKGKTTFDLPVLGWNPTPSILALAVLSQPLLTCSIMPDKGERMSTPLISQQASRLPSWRFWLRNHWLR